MSGVQEVPGPAGLPAAPPYGRTSLADVLPAVARSLGVGTAATVPADALRLPEAARVCVVLVDGLGELALADRGGHAPFLRRLRSAGGAHRVISAGFPTTTATSMGLLGTGLPPGGHGLVGYEVLDPARDVLVNQLAWDPELDPRRWQPHPTVLQEVQAAGVDVVRVGPAHFDGSGLTEAVLRGGRFVATADVLDARVEAAVAAVRSAPRTLVYLYWGQLDRTGHEHGVGSRQWGEELERVDAALGQLARRLPRDCHLVVTADHGMVDVPFARRVDLAAEPQLRAGVRHAGGEPRALHLYCEPGAAVDVAARWRGVLGEQAWVLSRAEAVAAGWFGPVAPAVLERIGDVLAVMRTDIAVVNSERQRPQVLRLLGHHGALTEEERLVPLFVTGGG